MSALDIHVHYVSRIEGHGNIVVKVEDNQVKELRWEIPEAPRFFEAMVRGKHYSDVVFIVSRICGICGIGHTFTAIQALEKALGFEPSEQTLLLRKLLLHGETVQSHTLHFGYLALPDFFGVPNIIPLVQTHKEQVLAIIRLHRLANELCDLIGGRTTHPITTIVGGWTRLPTEGELKELRRRLIEAINDVKTTINLFASLQMPDFQRETEYIALKKPDEYAFYDGEIASTDDEHTTPMSRYLEKIHEFIVPYSTAKRAKANRSSYMVGALARFNINYSKLSPLAQEAAEQLGLKPICYNTFANNLAQVVEVAHAIEDSIRIIDTLLARGIKEEKVEIKPKAGRGVGGVEVPRGLLIHDYTLDEQGRVVESNMIIPTNQNHQNIEEDLRAYLPQLLGKSKEEITLGLEMLVRAYDPCISCSTHFLRVEWG